MHSTRSQNLNAKLAGFSMIAGPLVLLTSSILYATGKGMNSDELGGLVQIFALFIFIFAVTGVTELLAVRTPGLAITLRVTGVLGCVYGVIFGVDSMLQGATGKGIVAQVGAMGELITYPGIIFPLTIIALGVALWRSRILPAPVAVLLILAGITFPMGRIPDIAVFYFISDALFVLSLGWTGRRLLSGQLPAGPAARE